MAAVKFEICLMHQKKKKKKITLNLRSPLLLRYPLYVYIFPATYKIHIGVGIYIIKPLFHYCGKWLNVFIWQQSFPI